MSNYETQKILQEGLREFGNWVKRSKEGYKKAMSGEETGGVGSATAGAIGTGLGKAYSAIKKKVSPVETVKSTRAPLVASRKPNVLSTIAAGIASRKTQESTTSRVNAYNTRAAARVSGTPLPKSEPSKLGTAKRLSATWEKMKSTPTPKNVVNFSSKKS